MPPPNRVRWTRDELLIVLNLYHKLRFGQFDEKQPVIVDLAKRIGRTSGAVAMKLSNLASLDPVLKLRGIRGLSRTPSGEIRIQLNQTREFPDILYFTSSISFA